MDQKTILQQHAQAEVKFRCPSGARFYMGRIHFREATGANEIRQIHALNHRVFAEEIAQHNQQASGILIDRFHGENRYFVAVRDGVVIGMISAHAGPEFSVTKRLPNPAELDNFPLPLEVRLLAIDPKYRNRTVLTGLLWQVYHYATWHRYSHLLISGISERQPMYKKMGFSTLGPAVSDGKASFIPMVMPIGCKAEGPGPTRLRLHERRWQRSANRGEPVSLMPGPVCIYPLVARAWASPPVSHRSATFIESYEEVRRGLNRLLDGMAVTLFPGAGTLANDVVAANLKAIFGDQPGLILTNGEFGERIARQAASAGLQFQQMWFQWGQPWSYAAIANDLKNKPAWIWAVHLETSTGVLNDAERLLRLAADAQCAVALDCVSSLGAAAIPQADALLMASGVSGKSLGSYAGLGLVFLSEKCRRLLVGKTLCPSFDLLRMCQTRGPLTTVPSPLLFALARALEIDFATDEAVVSRLHQYSALGRQVRGALRTAGINPLAHDSIAAPNITTFALPFPDFPDQCLEAGYQIAHGSPYLKQRGWGQIATMGDITPETLTPLFESLPGFVGKRMPFAEIGPAALCVSPSASNLF